MAVMLNGPALQRGRIDLLLKERQDERGRVFPGDIAGGVAVLVSDPRVGSGRQKAPDDRYAFVAGRPH